MTTKPDELRELAALFAECASDDFIAPTSESFLKAEKFLRDYAAALESAALHLRSEKLRCIDCHEPAPTAVCEICADLRRESVLAATSEELRPLVNRMRSAPLASGTYWADQLESIIGSKP